MHYNLSPPPPVYIPIPYPMYMPTGPSSSPQIYNPPISGESFYRKKQPTKYGSIKRNMRKWKRAANCALFYFYLKRFCKEVQFNRKQQFDKFLISIKTPLNAVKKMMLESLKEFLSIILVKS